MLARSTTTEHMTSAFWVSWVDIPRTFFFPVLVRFGVYILDGLDCGLMARASILRCARGYNSAGFVRIPRLRLLVP